MRLRKKQCLTLVELLLVVAIIGITSGFVLINIRKALQDQRFRTETAVVVENLRLAQDMMLLLNTDASLKFASAGEKEGIRYWIEVEEPPDNAWIRELQRPRKPLKTIRNIEFHDELPGMVEVNLIEIRFNKGGFQMSRGMMRLSDSPEENPPRGSLERFICLAGYPRPISSTETKEEGPACFAGKEQELFEQLTRYTAAEIQDKAIKTKKQKEDESKQPPPDTTGPKLERKPSTKSLKGPPAY